MSQEKLEFLYIFRTEGDEKVAKLVGVTQQLEGGAEKAAVGVAGLGKATDTTGASAASSATKTATFTENLGRHASAADVATKAQSRHNSELKTHVSDVQAASAAIRAFEGHSSIRAVEQFITKIAGLGPALQAIFPLVGALATVEVIGQMVHKVGELYNAWDPVIRAQQRSLEVGEAQLAGYVNLSKEAERLRFAEIGRVQGHPAQLLAEANQGDIFDARTSKAQIDRLLIERNSTATELRKLKQDRETGGLNEYNARGDLIGSSNSQAVSDKEKALTANLERFDKTIDYYTLALKNEQSRASAKRTQATDEIAFEARRISEAAQRAIDQANKRADKLVETNNEKFLTPIQKIEAQRVSSIAELRKDGVSPARIAAVDRSFGRDLALEAKKESDAFNHTRNQFEAEAAKEQGKRDRKETRLLFGVSKEDLKEASEGFRADYEILSIQLATDRENILRRSQRATRTAEITNGPNAEVLSINQGLNARLSLAKELYRLDLDRASEEDNIAKQRVLEARAEADLQRQSNDARLDAEFRILVLREKQADHAEKEGQQFYRAIRGGSQGIRQFFVGGLDNQASKIFGNVTGPIIQNIGQKLGGFGASLGLPDSVLKGTILDPHNADKPLITSQEKLRASIDANTAALGGGVPGLLSGLPKLPGISDLPGLGSLVSDGNGLTGGGSSAISKLVSKSGLGGLFSSLGGGAGIFASQGIGGLRDAITGDSGGTGAERAGVIGSAAAAGIGAGFGILGGIKQGGAAGATKAIGSGLAIAALLDPEPISKGALTIAASVSGLVSTLFGNTAKRYADDVQGRLYERRFIPPGELTKSLDFATGAYADSINYDARGRARSSPANTIINVNVSALDSQSVLDRSFDIASAVHKELTNGAHAVIDGVRGAVLAPA